MFTTCDQQNNHASRPAAPTTDGGLLTNLPMGARTRNIQSSSAATGREQDDDTSLNTDANEDQEQDFTIDHPNDLHAEYDDVGNIINSALEMMEDDALFPSEDDNNAEVDEEANCFEGRDSYRTQN